jgi:hypothetical protein
VPASNAIEGFLAAWDAPVAREALRLAALVRHSVPDAIERIYPDWRLIGYRKPVARGSKYFCFVAPQDGEVRLGFEYGVHLADPLGLLRGDGSQVRYLSSADIAGRDRDVEDYIRRAAASALLPKELLGTVDVQLRATAARRHSP